MCFLVFWKREKLVEKPSKEHKNHKNVFLPWSEGCLGLFIAPMCFSRQQPFKDCRPQKAFDWIDLDSLGNILTSCFRKGMDLENPTIIPKVMTLKSLQCINQCVIPVFVISRPF